MFLAGVWLGFEEPVAVPTERDAYADTYADRNAYAHADANAHTNAFELAVSDVQPYADRERPCLGCSRPPGYWIRS